MEIRYPNYYKKFVCIAGACPDTCCAGWEITVDRRSEQRYKAAQKKIENRDFAGKLKKHIKHGRILSDDITCPFLNRDGLCRIYLELGSEALCHTCARHPRHLEDYGNLHEMVLLLSCPEVARLVLEENEGGFYIRNLPERKGNMDGIDEKLLEQLLQVRESIWDVVNDTTNSTEECMIYALALAHDVQRRIAKGKYGEIPIVLKRYSTGNAVGDIVGQWEKRVREKKRETAEDLHQTRFFLMTDFLEEFAKLDTICLDWPDMLEACRIQMYHGKDSCVQYEERHYNRKRQNPETKRDLRNVFEYFVYSFLLSALYDEDLLTKVKMAVMCTMTIADLYVAADTLKLDDRIGICHALARQVENSDANRLMLEQILKKKTFSAARMMDAFISI